MTDQERIIKVKAAILELENYSSSFKEDDLQSEFSRVLIKERMKVLGWVLREIFEVKA